MSNSIPIAVRIVNNSQNVSGQSSEVDVYIFLGIIIFWAIVLFIGLWDQRNL